jgi:flagellar motor switch protein FliN/FliY
VTAPVDFRPFPGRRLRRVSRAEADLARALRIRARLEALSPVAFDLGRKIGLGGATMSLARVEARAVEELRHAFPGAWRFAVLADPLAGRRGFLALQGRFLEVMEERLDLTQKEREGGRDGLLGWMACQGLAAMGETLAGWRFCGLTDSAGEIGRHCRGSERLALAWIRISAGFAPGFAVWLEDEESLGRAVPGPAPALAEEVPLSFALRLGRVELTAREAGGLRCGDVVLFQPEPGDGRTLSCGGLRLRGTVEGCEFRLRDWSLETQGAAMENMNETMGQGMEAAVLEGLPVPVTIDAGAVQLTVGELSALRCGDVIVLGDLLLAPVNVRAGSRLIGRGELVDVDGRRGVRLLQVYLTGESHADAA